MTDDDLRARLRDADPAASLPPAAHPFTADLLERTMTTSAHRRLMPALAAAVLVLIVAGLGWALTRPAPQPLVTPAIGTAPPVTVDPAAPVTVELSAPGGGEAKCREPRPERLAGDADFVFAGTVTAVAGEVVTLAVTRVYKGAPAGVVRLAQEPESSETMMGSGKFETGKDYLVASAGGSVLICGYSGEADAPGLAELYQRAF